MKNKRTLKSMSKALIRRTRVFLKRNPNRFLNNISGVIHVGANTGQEIKLYAKNKLSVIWIEPIPEIFATLQSKLIGVSNQLAIKGLVTDKDDVEYDFNIASNDGASSSILELNLHQDIWPDVTFKKTIKLRSKTLPSLLMENQVNLSNYDALIMDTQGSELMILQGCEMILDKFSYIKTEVADFESYKGCGQLKDLQLFLNRHGFKEYSRNKTATHPNGGSYYDMIFKKIG